jgi:DNA-directed RNA polymerase specialized sigma24 family protein
MTGNHQDAEDVLQEASMNAYLSIPLVKTRLFRARLNLRDQLTDYFGKDRRNAMQTSRR